MTGRMLEAIETILLSEEPDCVLVYGDTNTALAGALAAVKLHIPVAHVEAGLRSRDREMPEEVNRVATDHISTSLFCPTETAVLNLKREGLEAGVHLVGDVMCDAVLHYGERANQESEVIDRPQLNEGEDLLATFHRAGNTDNIHHMREIAKGLSWLNRDITVVLPLHPRTRRMLKEAGEYHSLADVNVIDPVDYLDMLHLEQSAKAIVTDSGGVQKEAFLYRVPCITLRYETECVETVETGWNTLVGPDAEALMQAFRNLEGQEREEPHNPYGDGRAAQRIVRELIS